MQNSLRTVSKTITQADIDRYAVLSDDFNPLHVNPAFAATTSMGKPIAHGTLSVNLIWQTLARNLPPIQMAQIQLDIRFIKPVFAGSHLTAGGEADACQAGRYLVWIKDENDALVISGHAELLAGVDSTRTI